MNNPFEVIESRLSNIEALLLDLKQKPFQEKTAEEPEQILTVQEAAQLLNLTVSTIYSKVSKGEIPVLKSKKRLYFSRTELIEHLKEGRKKTIAEIEQDADRYLANRKGLK